MQVYVAELEVVVEWMDGVSPGYPNLLSATCFVACSE